MANNIKNSISIVERTDMFQILKLVPGTRYVKSGKNGYVVHSASPNSFTEGYIT